MPRRLPLLLLLAAAACGGSSSPNADFECEKLVNEYESLYVQRFGDHSHADFQDLAARAAKYADDDTPSCLTLQGLTDTIANDGAADEIVEAVDTPNLRGPKEPSPVAMGFFVLMMIVSTVAGIWLLIIAFQESIVWGLLYLFVPFASFVFVVMHWEKAKTPFLVSVASTALGFFAVFASAS